MVEDAAPIEKELPQHVREFFADLSKEDLQLLKTGMEFAKWFRTTSKFTRALVMTAFAVFGAAVGAAQGWDYVVAKWFSK